MTPTEAELIKAIDMLVANQVLFLQAMYILEERVRILEGVQPVAGEKQTIQ